MRLSEEELAAVVRFEIDQAQGYDSSVLSVKRQEALDFYNGIMKAPAEGRSSIVSKDVADSLHALMSQLAPIIKTTLIEFKPKGEEDEPQAQAETDFVKDAIDQAKGWQTIFNGIHDALLIGNGWLKITTEDKTSVTTETYPPELSDVQLFVLNQPTAANQTVEVRASKYKTTVRRTTTRTVLAFECVPPEDMLFSEGAGQQDIQDQRFVGQRKLYSDAQLHELGISKETIDQIPLAQHTLWPAALAREGIYQDSTNVQPAQTSQQLREVYCCYQLLSSRDSLKSERRYIWLGGSKILKNEPVDSVPYVTGSPVPMPHRVQGQGLYELLASIQSGKTHILRNFMDNLAVMNGSRIAAREGTVNMDDLTNGRLNGVVRTEGPPLECVAPLPAADIGPQALGGLNYLDHVRVARVGSSVDVNELQAQIMKSSATAAAGQLAQVEQMAGWFAGNIVETILKPAFARVHKLLREELGGPVQAKVRGKWQQSDTSQWPERENLTVNMGMTTAEKAARVGTLTSVISKQSEIIAQGGEGILTDKAKVYNAMTDWLRASDIDTPEQYLIDPNSDEAKAVMQQRAQGQQQQQQQMQQMQLQLMRMDQSFKLLMQKNDLDYKTWSDLLDAEVKEAQVTADNVVKIKQMNTAKVTADVEVDKKRD